MKNFRGSALAAGVGTPASAPHELPRSSLHFYLGFKHRDCLFDVVVPVFCRDVPEGTVTFDVVGIEVFSLASP